MTHEKLMKKPELTQEEANAALRLAIRQTESCLGEFSQQFKSIFSEGGFYSPAPNEQWTNGFWTGELWLAYENSGDDRFREAAAKQIDSFLTRIETGNRTDTHDLGFLYSLSCVAGYKLTGNQTARKAALLAADRLKARFHQKGRFIQAWGSLENRNNYRLIIDCLLNLPLLYWATEETGLPEYADVARAHLETALSVIIRPDYSTYHTYYFDPDTGMPLRGVTHQGYSADSAWARGQSWGVYGLALSYRYTKDPKYLEDFKHVTDYFISHLPENLIPYWDFIFEEGSEEPWDSSASAIAICGILEMCKYLPEAEAAPYLAAAKRMMKALVDLCAVTSPEISNGQLLHGVYGKKTPYNDCIDHGIDECNLWGDYYYVEALTRMTKDWNPYW
ncbi:glucoronyl hydrolase [Clostridium sp. WB02_MRS01]|uniref:glycoside hydrolase family 88 protein n=1 Tax=Clostridium sp. WB02_MRS01 TaxID=2605777 RepID=UPI0012B43F9D|nr:glycoside hydrolase family 88 protein [Clostridium sp. WB02_MRS01]MSS08453.1 glucoronyl hydrolase [Clostridium sp. WB02_MRS01]